MCIYIYVQINNNVFISIYTYTHIECVHGVHGNASLNSPSVFLLLQAGLTRGRWLASRSLSLSLSISLSLSLSPCPRPPTPQEDGALSLRTGLIRIPMPYTFAPILNNLPLLRGTIDHHSLTTSCSAAWLDKSRTGLGCVRICIQGLTMESKD